MLLILFGTAGAGKNYVGEILSQHYGFYFYDADDDLTPGMISAIESRMAIDPNTRNEYFDVIIEKTKQIRVQHEKLAVSQAMIYDENRHQVLKALPDARFIYIKADPEQIDKRILERNDWVDVDYARKIRDHLEEPTLRHFVLDNNKGKEHVTNQLDKLFGGSK